MRDLHSKAHVEKKRKKRKKVFFFIPALLVVFLLGYTYYAFSERFHVTEVIISKTAFVPHEEAKAKVQEMISKKMFGLIPKRSALLIGKAHIEQQLLMTYPSIKEITTDISDNTLYIEIAERVASVVMCLESTTCYFIDDEGVAFVEAPQFEGSSFLKLKTFNDQVTTGKVAIEPAELQIIIQEVSVFEALGISVLHVVIKSEQEMDFIASNETIFMIHRKDAPEEVEERLKALVSSRADIVSGTYSYIDLRIDSKIFLKNKES